MIRRYRPKTRIAIQPDGDIVSLIERQVEIFERIALQLESIDARLERLACAAEDSRNISSQPF